MMGLVDALARRRNVLAPSDISSIRSATMIRAAASINARWEKGLREITQMPRGDDVELLRVQPEQGGILSRRFQHVLGLPHLPDDRQCRDQPERADQERALLPGQPVVGLVVDSHAVCT